MMDEANVDPLNGCGLFLGFTFKSFEHIRGIVQQG